tara:strand:- start:515 stop:643 length:129 start_codon:yes stop_codon:yes gene_type:complete
MFWYIYDSYNKLNTEEERKDFKNYLYQKRDEVIKEVKYSEFI